MKAFDEGISDVFGYASQASIEIAAFRANGYPEMDQTEFVLIAPDQMQPILRLSEDMEFEESGKILFLELPIYTNHYFDSSLSFYQVMKSQKKPSETVVIMTDVMEIDELKKSALIRTLFKGKMVKAISQYQETLLSELDSPKSPN